VPRAGPKEIMSERLERRVPVAHLYLYEADGVYRCNVLQACLETGAGTVDVIVVIFLSATAAATATATATASSKNYYLNNCHHHYLTATTDITTTGLTDKQTNKLTN
jgi:hypothetical protein